MGGQALRLRVLLLLPLPPVPVPVPLLLLLLLARPWVSATAAWLEGGRTPPRR